MTSGRNVAVVGATGLVGSAMRGLLETRGFPVGSLRLMASPRSAGKKIGTAWGEVEVESLDDCDPTGIDIAIFSAGGSRALAHAPRFRDAGAVVIDNSSAFRMHDDVPLVVADVNDDALRDHRGIIANPNCTTMVLMMALAPLHRRRAVQRLWATSYQSVSGSGLAGIQTLEAEQAHFASQANALVHGGWRAPESSTYSRPIACNVLPHAGQFTEADHTDEEWKLVRETRKILAAPHIEVEPTCVRVPVVAGHGIAATVEFADAFPVAEAKAILAESPGIQVWDDSKVPTPLDSAGQDDCIVGRLRGTVGRPGGLSFFVVGDNLRKGAALNAVQLAERLPA